MSVLEDEIRRIVREEIARATPVPLPPGPRTPEPPKTWREWLDTPSRCPLGCEPNTMCGNAACPLRVTQTFGNGVLVMDEAVASGTGILSVGLDADRTVVINDFRYTPPATNVPPDKRTGCTCPQGRETSCKDPTCPWMR